MTEPVPSDYDRLVQDPRLDALDDLVHPYYQPPSETEHSFPVVGQGVSAEMYKQMSLAQGDGVLVTDDGHHSHYLDLLPGGASETNAQNRMILRVAQNTGRGEAILAGFYHVFYQDMLIDFPPVTTATTYHVCITYDPRNEDTEHGPLKIETYAGTPPRTHGRRHIVLHTVERRPNQLLTDAVREMHRQYISPTIAVFHRDRLPEATDVLYGSLAVKNNQTVDGVLRPGTGELYEARGEHGWQNLFAGPWHTISPRGNWEHVSGREVQARQTALGIQMRGSLSGSNRTSTTFLGIMPDHLRPARLVEPSAFILAINVSTQSLEIRPDGEIHTRLSQHDYDTRRISFDGIIFA